MICNQVIDLQKPTSSGWEGTGFGRRFLFRYRCPSCNAPKVMRASSFRGTNPVASVGGVVCGAERHLPADHAACGATTCPKSDRCLRAHPDPTNPRQTCGSFRPGDDCDAFIEVP